MAIAVARTAATTPTLRPGAAFTLLGAIQVTLIATITVITVALPAIRRDLGLDASDLVLLTSAYGVSFGGLLLFAGRLGDLLGHRLVLTAGLAIFGLASAAAGFAPTFPPLFAARFTQGIGAALAAPAAMALLGSVFPDPESRARATAVWGVLSAAGATAGTVLSGVMMTWMSWRWLFLAPVLVSAIAVTAAPRLIPAGPPPARGRIHWPGAVLAVIGLATFVHGTQHSWWETAAGAVLLGLFGLDQRGRSDPLLPLPLLGPRVLPLATVAVTAAVMATAFFLLALHLQQVRGLSPLRTSAVFLLPTPVLAASGPLSGALIPRVGVRKVMALGSSICAVGLLLLGVLPPPYPGLLVFPLGAGLAFASAAVAVLRDAPAGQAGLVGGLLNTAMEIGPPVGLAALTALSSTITHNAPDRYTAAFALAAALVAITVAVTALWALRPSHIRNTRGEQGR